MKTSGKLWSGVFAPRNVEIEPTIANIYIYISIYSNIKTLIN